MVSQELDQGERKLPIPVGQRIIAALVRVGHGADDDTANSPEHLQHLRAGRTKLDWDDLTAVGRCIGDEDTPRNTLENLCCEDDTQGVGEVEDEDEGVEEHQTEDGGPSISNSARDWPSDEDSDESAQLSRARQGRCPSWWDVVSSVWQQGTIVPLKHRQGEEVVGQEDVVRLH